MSMESFPRRDRGSNQKKRQSVKGRTVLKLWAKKSWELVREPSMADQSAELGVAWQVTFSASLLPKAKLHEHSCTCCLHMEGTQ